MADKFSNPSGNAGNWSATSTWADSDGGTAGVTIPSASDRAIISAGDTVTNDSNHAVGSVEIVSGGVLNGGSGNILYLDDNSEAIIFENNGSVTATPRLHFRGGTSRSAKFGSGTFGVISVEFSSAATLTMTSALTSSGNLSLTSNSTLTTSGSNYAITTTGDVSVEGTLTGNASAISMDSLTIASGGTYSATSGVTTLTGKNGGGYSIQVTGTFTHNKGKVKIDFNTGNTNDGTSAIWDEMYDYEVDMNSTGYGVTNYDKSNATMVVLNNLTVTQGKFKFGTAGDALTVHGLTTVTSNGLFGEDTAPTGTHTFNGLVTNSGQWDTSSGTNN